MATDNTPWRFDSLSIAPSLGFTFVWAIYKPGYDPRLLRLDDGLWRDSTGIVCNPNPWCWVPEMHVYGKPTPPRSIQSANNQFVALPDPHTMPGEVIEVEFDGCLPMQLRSIDRVGGWVGLNGWVPTKAELGKVKGWVRLTPVPPTPKATKYEIIPYTLERDIYKWITGADTLSLQKERARVLVNYIKEAYSV